MTGGEPGEAVRKSGAGETGPTREIMGMSPGQFLGGLVGWALLLFPFFAFFALLVEPLAPSVLESVFIATLFIGLPAGGALIAFFHVRRWPKALYVAAAVLLVPYVVGVAVGGAGFAERDGEDLAQVLKDVIGHVIFYWSWLFFMPFAVGFLVGAELWRRSRPAFRDAGLERAAARAWGIDAGRLTQRQAARLTTLHASHANITDLEGLQHAAALKELDLSDNAITDLGPLANLRQLEAVNLSHNTITDIKNLPGVGVSPLTGEEVGSALRRLDLSQNQVGDLGPITALRALAIVDVSGNAITDISPLLGLEALERVNLSGNPLDPTPGSATMEHIQLLRERGVEVLVDRE